MEIVIEAGEDTDLTELLTAFHDSGEVGGSEIVDIRATPSETSFVGSGMAELIQLVVVLGSSGAIAAVTTIALKYFDTRPTGSLKIIVTDGPRSESVETTRVDAQTIKSFLQGYQPKE